VVYCNGTVDTDARVDEGAYPSQMITTLIFPLLFASMQTFSSLHITPTVPDDKQSTVGSEVGCSCVRFVTQYRKDLPVQDASRYVATTTAPSVGAVALMVYPSGSWHVALVTGVSDEGVAIAETNYRSCEFGTRTIPHDYSRLVGYL
jgi:hypothetical protein